jgi:UDPglucose--hexose-1-phosphate uridylyltransferase
MSEIRTDPLTGLTTIFAPERAKRPIAIKSSQGDEDQTAEQIASDPFAEGKEDETEPELFAVRAPGSKPNGPGWSLRVVDNKYPALTPVSTPGSEHDSFGVHEVIVECPHYETHISRLDLASFQNMFHAYRARLRVHRQNPRLQYAIIFKNQGVLGGASLGHAHSQLMVSHVIPEALHREIATAQQYQAEQGTSLFEQLASDPVLVTQHFDLICPYASRFAFETWLIPRSRGTHYDHSRDEELDDLAAITRRLLKALETILGSHDLNFVIQTPPFPTGDDAGYTWTLRIYPRLAHLAGFELASQMYVNPVFPEQARELLQRELAKEQS